MNTNIPYAIAKHHCLDGSRMRSGHLKLSISLLATPDGWEDGCTSAVQVVITVASRLFAASLELHLSQQLNSASGHVDALSCKHVPYRSVSRVKL